MNGVAALNSVNSWLKASSSSIAAPAALLSRPGCAVRATSRGICSAAQRLPRGIPCRILLARFEQAARLSERRTAFGCAERRVSAGGVRRLYSVAASRVARLRDSAVHMKKQSKALRAG